ncbi:MAG: Na/Pi cotransporter family protein [Bacteroidaceae bacterium]|nr:Na/Pi cotransporter family protein [Bacteroidaceae bacterium]
MHTIVQVLKMLGCLGMFLYGMSLMSAGLQKFAGQSLRSFISRMTSSTPRCLFTGFVVTVLVQSSTATTLMLVSFVNAGLMSLYNAIGVIMGANVGTTVTAWLFAVSFDGAFSLGAIAVPTMFLAFIFFTRKREKLKSLGEFLMGFALLFLGLSMLKDTSFPLLSSDGVRNLLTPLTVYGYFSVLIFIVIGAIMTLMLQSSAATTSITMLLLAVGALPFNLAVAMVLGENIGTTITSNLAATVANESAKRTARAHLLFNLVGSVIVIVLFNPYIRLNGLIVEAFGFPNPCLADFSLLSSQNPADAAMKAQLEGSLPYAVAIVHTLFNVITTLLLVWFIPVIEKVVIRMVPSNEEEKEQHRLLYISGGLLHTAELSLDQADREIEHFAQICYKDFDYARQAINETDKEKLDILKGKLVKYEEITDRVEYEIADYLNKVCRDEISDDANTRVKSMLKIVSEMESLGDSGEAIARLIARKDSNGKTFDITMLANINRMLDLVDNAYKVMIENLKKPYVDDITNAQEAEQAINELRNELREKHVSDSEKTDYDYICGVYYLDLVCELERIGDFMINISEARLSKPKHAIA